MKGGFAKGGQKGGGKNDWQIKGGFSSSKGNWTNKGVSTWPGKGGYKGYSTGRGGKGNMLFNIDGDPNDNLQAVGNGYNNGYNNYYPNFVHPNSWETLAMLEEDDENDMNEDENFKANDFNEVDD